MGIGLMIIFPNISIFFFNQVIYIEKRKNRDLEPRTRYKLEERTLLILEVLVYRSSPSITMYVNLKIKIDQFELAESLPSTSRLQLERSNG